LGKPGPLTVLADGFPDKLSLSWRCGHASLGKQEGLLRDTVYNPLLLSLLVWTNNRKTDHVGRQSSRPNQRHEGNPPREFLAGSLPSA
jgi:hypothetical protein